MQLNTLALTLAAAVSSVAAYPITGDDVNCRTGPGTSFKSVKTYPKGTDVKLSCQTYGEVIFGNSIWDKTQDGCYVSDYYVKTGSNNMVTGECPDNGNGSGGSVYQGKINRTEIISRAEYWTKQNVPYSMEKTYPDPQGRYYRTDCSGLVSMALHAMAPGYSTVTLPQIAVAISWDDLKAGDFIGTLGAGTGGSGGHVTVFQSWVDDAHTQYWSLECANKEKGCLRQKRNVKWKVGSNTAKPYRYTKVIN
ncbi:hypothetical protein MYCTH_81466 [Thermothelomyces thermophilus ATCC 42464]|uniref:NlpC/P60 domain-containing protein n=1 Tax=Thermothelomyces thermophilus (strain ATCC 42464 / BCRC 31852 / DSM 1799) TaxID=573729 RepID=G2QD02_THET4|nr:uncharacterized protein MYCTH_81466 [Thermothelomyces thermophilus ATCC 42464]AEO57422.1 hypothetical protein MYCTH_81466 [Thermothelomyces thermophilus ATCC 42464]